MTARDLDWPIIGNGCENLPFPLHDRVAVETTYGKRSLIKPNTIRMYDEL